MLVRLSRVVTVSRWLMDGTLLTEEAPSKKVKGMGTARGMALGSASVVVVARANAHRNVYENLILMVVMVEVWLPDWTISSRMDKGISNEVAQEEQGV